MDWRPWQLSFNFASHVTVYEIQLTDGIRCVPGLNSKEPGGRKEMAKRGHAHEPHGAAWTGSLDLGSSLTPAGRAEGQPSAHALRHALQQNGVLLDHFIIRHEQHWWNRDADGRVSAWDPRIAVVLKHDEEVPAAGDERARVRQQQVSLFHHGL